MIINELIHLSQCCTVTDNPDDVVTKLYVLAGYNSSQSHFHIKYG